MQTLVDLPLRTGANPKRLMFSVKHSRRVFEQKHSQLVRVSAAVLGEVVDWGEVSVLEWVSE